MAKRKTSAALQKVEYEAIRLEEGLMALRDLAAERAAISKADALSTCVDIVATALLNNVNRLYEIADEKAVVK